MHESDIIVRQARKLAAQRAAEYVQKKLREPGYHRRFKKRNLASKNRKRDTVNKQSDKIISAETFPISTKEDTSCTVISCKCHESSDHIVTSLPFDIDIRLIER